MARGQKSKKIISDKIVSMFEGAFLYDKEIRIPIEEDGELIQIKCVLSAAKTNVEEGSENAIPTIESINKTESSNVLDEDKKIVKISDEEKANLASLMSSLGL